MADCLGELNRDNVTDVTPIQDRSDRFEEGRVSQYVADGKYLRGTIGCLAKVDALLPIVGHWFLQQYMIALAKERHSGLEVLRVLRGYDRRIGDPGPTRQLLPIRELMPFLDLVGFDERSPARIVRFRYSRNLQLVGMVQRIRCQ
jgi:hypothetical protein